ncbi:hypothetical protein ACFVWR_10250 [Leifsonia sp. NPDC058292]|uniref:hypothetical protein n=1 Tax=Leifsonia sp. NPDC058292 TaxID=3346428 RepID=UPI0036DB9579
MTSGDRYLYLLDRPDAASYSRARRQGAWWAVAGFAVIWALIAALVLNPAFERRPVDRSELIGTWAGHGSASQGDVVVELRRDGTYTAAGFRFPADMDHTGSWELYDSVAGPSIDLHGRVSGAYMGVFWYFFQPRISVCDGDPDDPRSCTTLVKTASAG